MNVSNIAPRSPSGFTLIEMILALALAVIVMGALVLGIQTTLVALEKHRGTIEETQVARAVMARIVSDIRCTVIPEEPELEGLDAIEDGLGGGMAAMAGMTDSDTSGTLSSGTSGTDGSSTADLASSFGASSTSTGTTTTESLLPKVGLRGTATVLELDVSRLPRIDEYQGIVRGTVGAIDIPSDVKTVVYGLRTAAGSSPSSTTGDILADSGVTGADLTGTGLIRVETDRSVMLYAMLGGADVTSLGYEELLAPEVTDLQFRYFDGTAWVTEWDSETMEKLPKAVEIQLIVDPEAAKLTPEERAAQISADPTLAASGTVYRQVVAIQAALDDPPESTTEEDEEATDSTGTSTSGMGASGMSSTGSNASGTSGTP